MSSGGWLVQTVCSRSGSAGEPQPEAKPVARSSTRRMTAAPPWPVTRVAQPTRRAAN